MENEVDKILRNYADTNGIYYELSAKNADGETIIKYTSHIEAADVAGYAGLVDEYILKQAINEASEEPDTQLDEVTNRDEWQGALDKLTVIGG